MFLQLTFYADEERPRLETISFYKKGMPLRLIAQTLGGISINVTSINYDFYF